MWNRDIWRGLAMTEKSSKMPIIRKKNTEAQDAKTTHEPIANIYYPSRSVAPTYEAVQVDKYANADETSNTVMIAIDNSNNSEAAFDFYLKKLHKPGNDIMFTHSVEHPHFSDGFAFSKMQSLSETVAEYKEFVKAKQEEVTNLEKKFGEKLDGMQIKHSLKTIDYGTRNAGEGLCKLAEETKPCMIVMGSRGHGLVSRTILGSVSHYVLHHAVSPVLVCHHGKEHLLNPRPEPEADIFLS